MPIKINCPHCDRSYNLADNLAGKTIRCRDCKGTFSVAEPSDDVEIVEEDDNEFAELPPAKTAAPRPKARTRKPAGSSRNILYSNLPLPVVLGVVGGLTGLGLLIWALVAFVLPRWQSTPLTLLREYATITREAADALDAVTDRDSAATASKKLSDLSKQLASITTKAKNLKAKRNPTPEEKTEIQQLGFELRQIVSRIQVANQRLKAVPGTLEVLKPSWDEYDAAQKNFNQSAAGL